MKRPDKKLVLENGREFLGYGYGADKQTVCEIVFNTSMVGYQEILSDPSYTNQIVVMTYPLIGNYGITDEDFETKSLTIGGMIVRECSENPSNFRYTKTISEVFEEHGIPCISGIDTRLLTRIIRNEGCQRAAIVNADMPTDEALKLIASTPVDHNVVSKVSCRKRWFSRTAHHRFDVVAIDCGIKYNIVRSLNQRGCNVIIVPFDTPAEEIMAFNPHGIFISNGPGDPSDVPQVARLVEQMRGRIPIFGICLGHQLKNLLTGKIEITSQNHNYAIDADSLKGTRLEVTHINLLDGTVEGVETRADKIFSVQYHPESAPGPQDSTYLFDKFIKLMEDNRHA